MERQGVVTCDANPLVDPSHASYHAIERPETNLMVGVMGQHAPIFSVASFRAWLASRPDEEHWELIEGVPVMMTPPNRRHQRIASNLETLLNTALKRHDPAFAAYHDIGVNIVSTVPYDPEPDVAVIREDENPDPRYAERFYLVAEVLSESDKGIIESKRDIYRAHPSCTCILLVRQDRPEITVEHRIDGGWRSQVLHAADQLIVPEFGLTCPVRDVYRDTSLG
jgi:Uma2 family endonuclease